MAEWLSSWLAEQEDRGSIPGLATWIFRDWLSPASKSRYGWKIAKSTLILKTTNQPNIKFTNKILLKYWYWLLVKLLGVEKEKIKISSRKIRHSLGGVPPCKIPSTVGKGLVHLLNQKPFYWIHKNLRGLQWKKTRTKIVLLFVNG